MKVLLTISLLVLTSTKVSAVEGVVCRGASCNPVQVEETRGAGLLNLRGDQKSKLDGPSQDPSNKNYLFNSKEDQTESSADIKLTEFTVGTCLINPENGKTFYKVLEKNDSTGKVRYVAENEEHNYMLRGNVVFWKQPESNAFKKLRRFPCNRTPNLFDDSYVKDCTKSNTVGDLYCNPKSKL